jgi:CRISPR-associated protein Cmr2
MTTERLTPNFVHAVAHCLATATAPAETLKPLVKQVLESGSTPTAEEIKKLHEQATALKLPKVALVYGGATRVKGYVFEATRLPEIRGASALLDYVGSLDMMHGIWYRHIQEEWAKDCIIYASGGNVLGFAPADKGEAIVRAIEQCYTEHTLTAQSIAVADSFDLIELRYGRLRFNEDGTPRYWVDDFLKHWENPELRRELAAYYYPPPGVDSGDDSDEAVQQRFVNRKTFGELVTVLSTQFYRRRDTLTPPGQGYTLLPWAEKCDSSDVRPATWRGRIGDDERELSTASARKRVIGQILKKEDIRTDWYDNTFDWEIPRLLSDSSWESEWEHQLETTHTDSPYAHHRTGGEQPPRDLDQIAAVRGAKGYIGIIYADGNNVGRLLATLSTPQEYHALSAALDSASQQAVFAALADHLHPDTVPDPRAKDGTRRVHPFEILTIGGDDLLIIVPGHLACDIAAAIGREFETRIEKQFQKDKTLKELLARSKLQPTDAQQRSDRYVGKANADDQFDYPQPPVGLSAGLIIAQENTPIFFLRELVEQLQKNAKKLARARASHDTRGSIDFMVLKSITMVLDTIDAFREAALGTGEGSPRRLTARPYTWHEFAGLLHTLRAIKDAGFPKSQLYRLRQVMMDEQPPAILSSTMEYLYTSVRLKSDYRDVLRTAVEGPWQEHAAHSAVGPWLPIADKQWETIWADLGELYDMVESWKERANDH